MSARKVMRIDLLNGILCSVYRFAQSEWVKCAHVCSIVWIGGVCALLSAHWNVLLSVWSMTARNGLMFRLFNFQVNISFDGNGHFRSTKTEHCNPFTGNLFSACSYVWGAGNMATHNGYARLRLSMEYLLNFQVDFKSVAPMEWFCRFFTLAFAWSFSIQWHERNENCKHTKVPAFLFELHRNLMHWMIFIIYFV